MSDYKLDRTKFRAQTADEASNHTVFYQNLTWKERCKIAGYLNSIAFNYPESNPPKLDRTKFKARARS